MGSAQEGLASVYVHLSYDPESLTVQEIMPSGPFGVFAGGIIVQERGLVRSLGGCAAPGEGSFGVEPAWARVATLRMRGEKPGLTRVRLSQADGLHGVSVFGRFGNLDASRVEFRGTDVRITAPKMLSGRRSRAD